ncbi:hypothetical protein Nepgr_026393 [Nepenthes gracilis]|uniref:HTH La-type RNA-binding domain-containing protein n=1 Tax=Nepenthes gracilis TaxID=150966 RepID=A0AAD3T7S2_NEPGR|nr:hypothetical protein Nepgr_026393 [Nepenthes gracilis]
MAATANPNPQTTTLSPRSSGFASDVQGTRRSPSGGRTSSPWTQIVRGGESEVSNTGQTGTPTSPPAAVSAVQEDSVANKGVASPENLSVESQPESSVNGNGNGAKKPVWNKQPSNRNLDSSPVMDSVSWPALSDSTKPSSKLSPSESFKIPSDASVYLSQVTGNTSPSPSPSPSQSSSSQKHVTGHANPNPTPNHGRPNRQKSTRRDGGGTGLANGGFSHQSSPHASGGELTHNNSSMIPGSGGGLDVSARDQTHHSTNRETGQRNSGDHPQQRNSYRRGNSGQHSRGDGSHQNYGGSRRDQDRGNHDWNHQRNFNGRDGKDAPMQQLRPSQRSFIRQPPPPPPPPGSVPFFPAAALLPFGHVGMSEFQQVYFIGPQSIPFVPTPPMFIPPPDPLLHAKIVNQIDYYFSNENLIRDTYLRKNMDEQGWVPISLIAGFKKVMQLTDNIQLISDAVRSSTVVEIQGDKIRKRDNWRRWIMPPSVQFPTASGFQSPQPPGHDVLAARIQTIALDENAASSSNLIRQANFKADPLQRSSSWDSVSQPQAPNDGMSSSGS